MKKQYDYLTLNHSFEEVSKQLESLRICNNKFMLEIYDTDLRGVDPYYEGLSDEMKSKIKKECEINPWYYLRSMAYVNENGDRVMFRLTRGTCAQIYCILNDIDSYLVSPRQIGKTQAMIMLYTWIMFLSPYRYRIITSYMISHSHNNSCDNINFVRQHIKALPEYIFGINQVSIKRQSITSKSEYSSIDSYNTLGDVVNLRSYVCPLVQGYPYFDDVEFTRNSSYFLLEYEYEKKSVPKSHPFGCGISSAPGRLSDDTCKKICYNILPKCVYWVDDYYDDMLKLKSLLSQDNMIGIVYIKYSYRQLGFTDDWARKMYELIKDEEIFCREILLQREFPKRTFEELIAGIPDDLPEDLKS